MCFNCWWQKTLNASSDHVISFEKKTAYCYWIWCERGKHGGCVFGCISRCADTGFVADQYRFAVSLTGFFTLISTFLRIWFDLVQRRSKAHWKNIRKRNMLRRRCHGKQCGMAFGKCEARFVFIDSGCSDSTQALLKFLNPIEHDDWMAHSVMLSWTPWGLRFLPTKTPTQRPTHIRSDIWDRGYIDRVTIRVQICNDFLFHHSAKVCLIWLVISARRWYPWCWARRRKMSRLQRRCGACRHMASQ